MGDAVLEDLVVSPFFLNEWPIYFSEQHIIPHFSYSRNVQQPIVAPLEDSW